MGVMWRKKRKESRDEGYVSYQPLVDGAWSFLQSQVHCLIIH